ncbi:MAG: hypothetical protein ACOC33_03150 [bacterium]
MRNNIILLTVAICLFSCNDEKQIQKSWKLSHIFHSDSLNSTLEYFTKDDSFIDIFFGDEILTITENDSINTYLRYKFSNDINEIYSNYKKLIIYNTSDIDLLSNIKFKKRVNELKSCIVKKQ